MTALELAWMAGFFEGEGSVRINKPTHRNWGALLVSVVNTDREIIEFFHHRWRGCFKKATGMRPEQQDAWRWIIASRQAYTFLRAIQPFIRRSKVKERIAHALWFQEQKKRDSSEEYRQTQWEAYWWMGKLNERGKR